MVIWEGIQNLADITRRQVSNFFTFTSLQKYSSTETPASPDKHSYVFSIGLKASSSWTDWDKLVPSVSLHTEIVLNIRNMSDFFFPSSFWYFGSGIYFNCETSLLLAVFYCWNHSQLSWGIQSKGLCCSSDCFPSCTLPVQVNRVASVSLRQGMQRQLPREPVWVVSVALGEIIYLLRT